MEEEANILSVNVKWMSKQYNDIKLSLDEPLQTFKAQLWSLTGVPPERQKIMHKGIIPDNVALSTLNLKNGSKLMLIGSADAPPECNEQIKFFEDMSSQEKAQLLNENKCARLPSGIVNLGNTCYFNSIIQFLVPVTEFWDGISKSNTQDSRPSNPSLLARSLLDMKNRLPNTLDPFVPLLQIPILRKINPLFSRKDEKTGVYLQQDAEECLNCILSSINKISDENVSDKTFGFSTMVSFEPVQSSVNPEDNNKSDLAPPQSSNLCTFEHNLALTCYMGTQLKPVGAIMEGINLSLNEELLKFSEESGMDILHRKVSRMSTLPKYLIVHIVRFEWKQKSQVSHTDAVKAKICRRVNFERSLDVTNICTEDLQKKLRAANAIALDSDDSGKDQDSAITNFDGYELSSGKYATGRYELISVVTHQGRTTDAGHYICWTKDTREKTPDSNDSPVSSGFKAKKSKKMNDIWLKFDDDKVSEQDWDSFDLCGGRSDFHIAVLLLYKAKTVTVPCNKTI
ncbi:ubiquitin family protein [Theileria equi strain WA]|uniref:Ubiquitin carboxyl-terminal hydrolase n=1 Tax=Theileria equi strain WA TaxID=1537102 RepID=L0B3B2_THEEQ|nr:ubiquitin family protein [Theileria equi strain WA]AFZ81609.1 ubiquitin family protein [Theileria equi strain WA]|eukprot:XP_004831275.1 ubiquitin family protein [Theileria equi strain WA]